MLFDSDEMDVIQDQLDPEEDTYMADESTNLNETQGDYNNEFDSDDEQSEEDEQTSDFGRVAFAYDPSQLTGGDGPAQNGHDYLKQVEIERNKYSAVSYAKPPCFATNGCNDKTKPDDGHTSSNPARVTTGDLKFRDEIIENFKKFRGIIHEARGCQGDDGDTDADLPPQIRSLLRMTQLEIHLTLESIANRSEVAGNNANFDVEWVYNLIAALSEPIEPDIYSTLRRLAKICLAWYRNNAEEELKCKDQNTSNKDGFVDNSEVGNGCSGISREGKQEEEDSASERLVSSLLIICIVRYYFGQKDLK